MADTPPPAATTVGMIVVATRDQAAGAARTVAGLTVLDRSLKQLARQKLGAIVLASDGSVPMPPTLPAGVTVRKVDGPGAIAALAAELGNPPVVPADEVRPSNDLASGIRVTDAASRKAAEDAIFAQLLRGDLGIVARWLNKPISFRITRYLLCKLPFTPNQVTVAAALVGLVGCALIAWGTWEAMVAGFLLTHAQSVLDGCDGELARVRFQMSPIGEWLDTLFDDLLNLALWAAMGIGLYREHGGERMWLYLAGAGCFMLAVYNYVSYWTLVKQKAGGELLKAKWWFAGGNDGKDIARGAFSGIMAVGFIMGRRDFFLFVFLLLALAGLVEAALIGGLVISGVYFYLSIGQLYLGPPKT